MWASKKLLGSEKAVDGTVESMCKCSGAYIWHASEEKSCVMEEFDGMVRGRAELAGGNWEEEGILSDKIEVEVLN